jgi:hypothetical protein
MGKRRKREPGGGGGIYFLVNRGQGSGIRGQGSEMLLSADCFYCALVDGYFLQTPAAGQTDYSAVENSEP